MSAQMTRPDEPTLFEYLTTLRRRWVWVTASVAAGLILAFTVSSLRPPTYEATARVLLADSAAQRALDPAGQNNRPLSREMSNEISLALSDSVESQVVDLVGERPDIRITAGDDADVLAFRATAASAVDAAAHANTWAEVYIGTKREEAVATIESAAGSLRTRLRELRDERQDLRAPLDDLERRINRAEDPEQVTSLQLQYDLLADDLRYELDLVTDQAQATANGLSDLQLQMEIAAVGGGRIVQVAAPPTETSNPPLSLNLPLGAVLGLVVGLLAALTIEARDTSLKAAEDVHAATDLPLLATIPLLQRRMDVQPELAGILDPKGMLADGYQKVRSGLEFLSFNEEVRTVLITSANPSEGKSTTAANLTAAVASVGRRAVLVDVDFRHPRVHSIFGVPQQPGLSDFVLSEVPAEAITRHIGDLDTTMWAIPTGRIPPNPASFVGTSRFLDTIDWLADQADVTILDAPPLLAVSEAHSLARHVDAVVLTAMAGSTTQAELLTVIDQLEQVGANLAGIVLVGVSRGDAYGRHKQYYSEPAPTPATVSAPAAPRQRAAWAPAATVGGSQRRAGDQSKTRGTEEVAGPAPGSPSEDDLIDLRVTDAQPAGAIQQPTASSPTAAGEPSTPRPRPTPAETSPAYRPSASRIHTGPHRALRTRRPEDSRSRRLAATKGPTGPTEPHWADVGADPSPPGERHQPSIDLTDRDRRPPSGRIPDEHDLALAEALEDLRRTTAGRTNGRHHPPADLDQPVWADDA